MASDWNIASHWPLFLDKTMTYSMASLPDSPASAQTATLKDDRMSLLSLPAELRQQIWELVFRQSGDYDPFILGWPSLTSDVWVAVSRWPLARTCRGLYEDIYYSLLGRRGLTILTARHAAELVRSVLPLGLQHASRATLIDPKTLSAGIDELTQLCGALRYVPALRELRVCSSRRCEFVLVAVLKSSPPSALRKLVIRCVLRTETLKLELDEDETLGSDPDKLTYYIERGRQGTMSDSRALLRLQSVR